MMTLHQITSSIRAAQGEIISLGPSPIGYVIWADIKGHSCRIIIPPDRRALTVISPVMGCQTHLMSDALSLQAWLSTYANN
jgi:hypothetical protein